jgi:glycosyltransferase involved in cell wall biosynthesis
VEYHFVEPEADTSSMTGSMAFGRLMGTLKADIFHVHGLGFASDLRALARLAPDTPIFVQDHADGVPRFWRRPALRRGLSVAAGVSFCSLEQAKPFAAAGLLSSKTSLYEIPECSSRFKPGDQEIARGLTGVTGDPAILWVGHLNANKDPLTVLGGVSRVVRQLPGLQLWCCFGTSPLMPEVHRRIESDENLRGRVHLLGKVPHEKIEQLMRAADIFALGSEREGSGCSVIEALACGLPPVVTDIPSFRALLGDGSLGALWPHGDEVKLSEALLSVAARPGTLMRRAVRAHFESQLSMSAAGEKFTRAYHDILARRRDIFQGLVTLGPDRPG